MSILNYSHPFNLHPEQRKILLDIEAAWGRHEVIVLPADTGAGKSVMLHTIASWLKSSKTTSATITPRVSLQQQYEKSFDTPVLYGANRYSCEVDDKLSCNDTKKHCGMYCENCVYTKARSLAKDSGKAIYNIHSYLYNKIEVDVLLVDEAHTVFDFLSQMATVKLWKSEVNYPDKPENYDDVLIWLNRAALATEAKIKDLDILVKKALRDNDDASLLIKEKSKLWKDLEGYRHCEKFAGIKPSIFFIEELTETRKNREEDLLLIRPKTMRGIGSWLFKPSLRKIVLSSATISKIDVDKLGLGQKRVAWINTTNAIDSSKRPIILEFAGNMGYKYQNSNIPAMASKIDELRKRHNNTKGFVHCTYGMAEKLKKHLKSSDYIWHTRNNKERKLKEFFAAKRGAVFVACGMAEGVDLAGIDYGWQAITKIQYPNKSDKLIDYWYTNDKSWITWLTARTVMQQSGRICRGAHDFGVTYILDSCFGSLDNKQWGILQQARDMWPQHFLARLQKSQSEQKTRRYQ